MDLFLISFIWIIGFGGLFNFFKKRLGRFFVLHSKLPVILNYYIIATPVILIEEFLTCETPFLQCITHTLPAFYLLFLIIYIIQNYFKLSYINLSLIFGFLGWFNEMFLVGRIFTYDIFDFIIITVLVVPIYFVVAILPVFYLNMARK